VRGRRGEGEDIKEGQDWAEWAWAGRGLCFVRGRSGAGRSCRGINISPAGGQSLVFVHRISVPGYPPEISPFQLMGGLPRMVLSPQTALSSSEPDYPGSLSSGRYFLSHTPIAAAAFCRNSLFGVPESVSLWGGQG
jgi:hypothetical protein